MSEERANSGDFLLKVPGMHCASCVAKISKAVEDAKICESYWVDSSARVLRLRPGHRGLNRSEFLSQIQTLLRKIGYASEVIGDATHGHSDQIFQLAFSLAGLLLSIFAIPHTSVPFERSHLLWLLLILVLFILASQEYFSSALAALKRKTFTMDTLVSVGAGSAFLLSMTLVVAQIPGHLYWIEAFAILLLIGLGHYLEGYVLERADKTLRGLSLLAPPKARLLDSSGKERDVLVSSLTLGDTVVLRPGDRVPADGRIIKGKSDLDESLLTGESAPKSKSEGDPVFSGTVNLSGNIQLSVEKLGEDMLLSQIVSTVMKLRQSRTEIQNFADRVSHVFVPTVIGLALLSFLLWLSIPEKMGAVASHLSFFSNVEHQSESAFWHAFSSALGVLVIACPCAMGLATPAALMAVSGIAARKGILIRDSRAIEAADRISHVFFDKTGTLSAAQASVVDTWKSPDFRAEYLYPVASQSRHPMSEALVRFSEEETQARKPLTAKIEELPGEGLRAQVIGRGTEVEISMGNHHLMERQKIKGLAVAQNFVARQLEEGRSLCYWAQNGILCAVFSFEDRLREGSEELIKNFQKFAEVRILSGDRQRVLGSMAGRLGLKPEDVLGELSPLDKVQILQSFQEKGGRVAFVGDGLNDAPVLQTADLGIAVSSATDLARQSSDIVLLNKETETILESFLLAKRGMITIRQNLFWAFSYNVIAIPLAFFGLISPILCTFSMAFSDLVIIFNSFRVFLLKKL